MNEADYLLNWLSEWGWSTSKRLHGACEALRLRFTCDGGPRGAERARRWRWRLIWRLRRSGHIERLANGSYGVAPAIILVSREGESHWYGARTPELRHAMASHGINIEITPQRDGPQRWRMVADEAHLRSVASQYEVGVHPERGADLLRALPSLPDALAQLSHTDIPIGQDWQQFRVDRNNWIPCETPFDPGLYRHRTGYAFDYIWVHADGRRYRLEEEFHRHAAQWQVAKPQVVLSHHRVERTLALWPTFSLPLLIERALYTASGLDATFENDKRVYTQIGSERAQHVARILGVTLAPSPAHRKGLAG